MKNKIKGVTIRTKTTSGHTAHTFVGFENEKIQIVQTFFTDKVDEMDKVVRQVGDMWLIKRGVAIKLETFYHIARVLSKMM